MTRSDSEDPKEEAVADLLRRVKLLEDAVFGPPDFGPRLQKLEQELAELSRTSTASIADLEKRLKQTLKIVAELRSLLAQKARRRPIPI